VRAKCGQGVRKKKILYTGSDFLIKPSRPPLQEFPTLYMPQNASDVINLTYHYDLHSYAYPFIEIFRVPSSSIDNTTIGTEVLAGDHGYPPAC